MVVVGAAAAAERRWPVAVAMARLVARSLARSLALVVAVTVVVAAAVMVMNWQQVE